MSSALDRLLSSRSVLSPEYTGPDLATLSSTMVTMIKHNMDWSHLVSEWDMDQEDTGALVTQVQNQINVRPSLADFSVTEVLESLLIQRTIKQIEVEFNNPYLKCVIFAL